MKVILSLNNPLWKTPERRRILDKAVRQSAAELESLIKRKILDSSPAGKVYRRGAIFKSGAAADRKLNRTRFKRKFFSLFDEKFAVAFEFHRASAPGQPPAVSTGGLLNSIRARALGELKAQVATAQKYAAALDQGAKIKNARIAARPFFASTAEEFRARFKQNLIDAIKQVGVKAQ
ncbi:MAG: hypothetical protein JSS81_26770 [Acidobacteria bacterium]|nr:hypothetical protein [Acidobacteriota bacterium]